jgi:hypothetical protein
MSLGERVRQRLGSYRLQKLADRDLDAFEAENRALIRSSEEAERAYEFASAEELEDRRGAYLELVELGQIRLEQLLASRLADLGTGEKERYRAAFHHEVLRRLSRFAAEIDPPHVGARLPG